MLDPLHYLPLLLERPGAFEHAANPTLARPGRSPMRGCSAACAPSGPMVRACASRGILQFHQEHPAPLIEQAIEQALQIGCVHADGVRLCLHQLCDPMPQLPPLDLRERPRFSRASAPSRLI